MTSLRSLHILIPSTLDDRLRAYFPNRGQKTLLIRTLLERQIQYLDQKTAQRVQIPSDSPLPAELLESAEVEALKTEAAAEAPGEGLKS